MVSKSHHLTKEELNRLLTPKPKPQPKLVLMPLPSTVHKPRLNPPLKPVYQPNLMLMPELQYELPRPVPFQY